MLSRYSMKVLWILFMMGLGVLHGNEEDLYQILGVSRSASTREIKKAYRKKALDTHPDKNKDVPPEEAAAAFQKVVHAFEILSDDSSRKQYDRTGRTKEEYHHRNAQRTQNGFHFQFRWNTGGRRPRRQQLKDRFDVKNAQSRILHLVSLSQLETIIADENGRLERNVLICFYTPPLEDLVMNQMVYPWPFAAMSAQGIWWEDLLQTTVVRYHKSNTLTEFFGIEQGGSLPEPVFLFGKRGQAFHELQSWDRRLSTNDRRVFDQWVWDQLRVDVTFVNHHDHPVEVYWINESTGHLKFTLQPNEAEAFSTILSHEWFVRDARTDTRHDSPNRNKLGMDTCLFRVKIVSDERTEYIIPKRNCYDLSGHCPFWNRDGKECDRNPVFMHDICRKTCRKCEPDVDEEEKSTTHNGSDEL